MKDYCAKANNSNIEAECKCNDIFCIKLFKLNELFNMALLSDKQRQHIALRLDSDGSDKEAFQYLSMIQGSIREFIHDGHNLYLYSSTTGNGKTAWSLRLLQSYFNAIWAEADLKCHGLFVNVPRLLLAIKNGYNEQNEYADYVLKNILDADVVVWDEIGVKALSEHDHEQLLNLINARIDANKSNIYTSNLTPNELQERIGERLYSRVVNYSNLVELRGADKRGLFK